MAAATITVAGGGAASCFWSPLPLHAAVRASILAPMKKRTANERLCECKMFIATPNCFGLQLKPRMGEIIRFQIRRFYVGARSNHTGKIDSALIEEKVR